MRLAVREGRVAVHSRVRNSGGSGGKPEPSISFDTVVVLGQGDISLSSMSGKLTVLRGQSVDHLFAEAEGTLVLNAMMLKDAIPRLERWYGIQVRVSDRVLLSRRVSGSFRYESASAALGVIALALECKATWRQSEVTLAPDPERGERK